MKENYNNSNQSNSLVFIRLLNFWEGSETLSSACLLGLLWTLKIQEKHHGSKKMYAKIPLYFIAIMQKGHICPIFWLEKFSVQNIAIISKNLLYEKMV